MQEVPEALGLNCASADKEKYWSELETIEQKVEMLHRTVRENIAILRNLTSRLEGILALERHKHGDNGEILVPLSEQWQRLGAVTTYLRPIER